MKHPSSVRVTIAGLVATATAVTVALAGPADAKGGHDHQPGPPLAPRTHFTMAPDGSSGLTVGGSHIPNIDSVKSTIRKYYNANSAGIANKDSSPYISEMRRIVALQTPVVAAQCFIEKKLHRNPAIVLDADDTTLWTYDMEVGDMHFNYNPAEQDVWVQGQRFPAVPGMVALQRADLSFRAVTEVRNKLVDAYKDIMNMQV